MHPFMPPLSVVVAYLLYLPFANTPLAIYAFTLFNVLLVSLVSVHIWRNSRFSFLAFVTIPIVLLLTSTALVQLPIAAVLAYFSAFRYFVRKRQTDGVFLGILAAFTRAELLFIPLLLSAYSVLERRWKDLLVLLLALPLLFYVWDYPQHWHSFSPTFNIPLDALVRGAVVALGASYAIVRLDRGVLLPVIGVFFAYLVSSGFGYAAGFPVKILYVVPFLTAPFFRGLRGQGGAIFAMLLVFVHVWLTTTTWAYPLLFKVIRARAYTESAIHVSRFAASVFPEVVAVPHVGPILYISDAHVAVVGAIAFEDGDIHCNWQGLRQADYIVCTYAVNSLCGCPGGPVITYVGNVPVFEANFVQ